MPDPLILTPQDRDYWIRTIIGETGSTDASAPAVAAVIANRMRDTGQSAKAVVLAPGQFEPWGTQKSAKQLLSYPTTSDAYKTAADIVDNMASGKTPDPTDGATQFYSPKAQAALGRAPPSWAQNGGGIPIGNHVFFGGGKPQGVDPFDYYGVGAPSASGASPATASASAPAKVAPPVPSATPARDASGGVDPFDYYHVPAATTGTPGATAAQPAASPAGTYTAPSGDTMAFVGAPGAAPPRTAPGAAESIAPTPALSPNDIVRMGSSGVPIIGPLLNYADAATNATLAPALNRFFSPENQLQGDTWQDRYAKSLAIQRGLDSTSAFAHPELNTGLGIAGAIASTVPAMAAAPAAFGVGEGPLLSRALPSMLTGGALSAGDTAARGGSLGDIERSGEIGGALGAAGPAAGEAIGGAASWLGNQAAIRADSGAKLIADEMRGADIVPMQARAALANLGPYGTMADVDPAMTQLARAIAPGNPAAMSILGRWAKARNAGSDARVADAVNTTLGPPPDAEAIVNEIGNRKISNTVDASTAKAALDTSLGNTTDPYNQLQDMMKARSAAANPLYKASLNNPVEWNPRLQQFLDDPTVRAALPQGVQIQRLESLANGEPFEPNDYVIKGFQNDPLTGQPTPVGGETPNFKTLNVMKKGLDAMVEGTRDATTGRLSQPGVALDQVRRSFVQTLDKINPDYAKARQAWAGPSETQDAYNRGLSIFANRSGPSGINTTPGALAAFAADATDSEKDALKIGARDAFNQQMTAAADPAAKAAALAGKDVTRQKLMTILGPDEGKQLADQLTFKYEDPIGQSFEKGLGLFKNREGIQGISDTPKALQTWMKNATPEELEAHKAGARQAIEMALSSAKNGDLSAARSLFSKSTANRAKLDQIFPNASDLFDTIDNEMAMRTNANTIASGSDTARTEAIRERLNPGKGEPAQDALGAMAGYALTGTPLGSVATALGSKTFRNTMSALSEAKRAQTMQSAARGLSLPEGPEQSALLDQIQRSFMRGPQVSALSAGTSRLTNAGVRNQEPAAPPWVWPGGLSALFRPNTQPPQ